MVAVLGASAGEAFQDSFEIPQNKVGFLIGRVAGTLNAMKVKANCSVEQHTLDEEHARVTMFGPPAGVKKCKQTINVLISGMMDPVTLSQLASPPPPDLEWVLGASGPAPRSWRCRRQAAADILVILAAANLPGLPPALPVKPVLPTLPTAMPGGASPGASVPPAMPLPAFPLPVAGMGTPHVPQVTQIQKPIEEEPNDYQLVNEELVEEEPLEEETNDTEPRDSSFNASPESFFTPQPVSFCRKRGGCFRVLATQKKIPRGSVGRMLEGASSSNVVCDLGVHASCPDCGELPVQSTSKFCDACGRRFVASGVRGTAPPKISDLTIEGFRSGIQVCLCGWPSHRSRTQVYASVC